MSAHAMPSRRRGVTFLELTVVVLFVGLLAAISTPRFASTLQHRQLRHAALEIADTVRYVQSVAITEGRTANLTVDPEQCAVISTNVDASSTPGTTIQLNLRTAYDSTINLYASFDSRLSMVFDFDGRPIVNDQLMSMGIIRVVSGNEGYDVRFNSRGNEVIVVPTDNDVIEFLD
ncbi:hypothetical protein LOC67_26745 [Stieleria sp. JC731]|uniref:pilus assembly FimT family protein n=1 Tax=Pirellulaceae TaxID=2691357 RepID=UPI001E48184D|nr:hypothetical protein [Stieleria sp. JC731]MCC9604168.1 hypothetical protein [Stieleria sp. JC731]